MINAHHKKEFLNTLPVERQVVLENIFQSAEPIEDRSGKDCSEFTPREIDQLFARDYTNNSVDFRRKCLLLDSYTKWMQQNYPVKYADYQGYAEQCAQMTYICSVEQINYDRIFTPIEFMDTIAEMSSIYDKMLFLAIYEGLWTTNHTTDFFLLRRESLNIQENSVTLPKGTKKIVSTTMMQLLLQGSSQTIREGIGVQKKTFDAIMEKDPTLCYKRFDITASKEADASKGVHETRLRIRNHIQNQRKVVLQEIQNPEKFTVSNIQMSGILNALIMNGITEGFNDYRTFEESPMAGSIADRYDLIYSGAQKNNLHRRFEPYFLSPKQMKPMPHSEAL